MELLTKANLLSELIKNYNTGRRIISPDSLAFNSYIVGVFRNYIKES